jgi:hypothetical protein
MVLTHLMVSCGSNNNAFPCTNVGVLMVEGTEAEEEDGENRARNQADVDTDGEDEADAHVASY